MHAFVVQEIDDKLSAREEQRDAEAFDAGMKEYNEGGRQSLEDLRKEPRSKRRDQA